MSVNTILLDFSVDSNLVQNDDAMHTLVNKMASLLGEHLTHMRPLFNQSLDTSTLYLYRSDRDALTSIRVFRNGLVTVSVEYYKRDNDPPLLSTDLSKRIERDLIEQSVGVKRAQALAPLKRCTFHRYFPSSDERLLEYDIDALVFEERTAFQKIQIVHSKSLGNMLVLDDLQNISEADLIYTETLMGRGVEEYKDKEIVILGGGDGALLFELLKEQPRHVTMLEIDEVVMQACAKYMRAICGDVLDQYERPNYKIVVGDCVSALEGFIAEGRRFDYVFGDLTDIPIAATRSEMAALENANAWQFIRKILELSFQILKPDGKFMTHGNGASCAESLALYEEQLRALRPKVAVSKTSAFVPSFLEDWVFYQLTFAN